MNPGFRLQGKNREGQAERKIRREGQEYLSGREDITGRPGNNQLYAPGSTAAGLNTEKRGIRGGTVRDYREC